MNQVFRKDENLERKVTMTFTQRDILLLKLCLQLVDRNYTKGGSLRFDIQRLQDKLSRESGESR